MRRFIKGIAEAVFCILLLASCTLQFPETISAKFTDANFKVNLGNVSKAVTGLTEEVQKNLPDDKVYDYNPDGTETLQHFLIARKMKIPHFVDVLKTIDYTQPSVTIPISEFTVDVPDVQETLNSFSSNFSDVQFAMLHIFVGLSNLDTDCPIDISNRINITADLELDAVSTPGKTLASYELPDMSAAEVLTTNLLHVSELHHQELKDKQASDFEHFKLTLKNVLLELIGDLTTEQSDRIKNETTKAEFAVMVYLDVPLECTATADIQLNVFELAQAGEAALGNDWLGRSEASNTEKIDKYLKVLKTVKFGMRVDGTLGLPISRLLITDTTVGAGKVFGSDGERFDVGKNVEIELTGEQIKNALATYPYMPELNFTIGKDTKIEVPRNATIAAVLSVSAVTDGTMELYNKSNRQERSAHGEEL